MRACAGLTRVGEIDWAQWRAVDLATLMFIVEPRRVLLIHKKRGLGAGKINAPGGKIDPGESPVQAAVRECEEEIGVTPLNPELAGTHRFQFVDGYSIHVWVYLARNYDGQPHETDEARPEWFELEDIPYSRMWADDRYWIPLLLAGRRFTADWIFDDDRMLDYVLRTDACPDERLPARASG